jgi:hypothetical protein
MVSVEKIADKLKRLEEFLSILQEGSAGFFGFQGRGRRKIFYVKQALRVNFPSRSDCTFSAPQVAGRKINCSGTRQRAPVFPRPFFGRISLLSTQF